MEELTKLSEELSQALIVSLTQDNLTIMLVALVIVGIIGLLIWSLSSEGRGGEREMGRPIDYKRVYVQLSKREKKIVLDMATDYLEEEVLMRRMKKETKQELYKKIGLAFDIPELVPPGETKARMKALEKHLNGHKPDIPGPAPIQELKPNNLPVKRSVKDTVKNLFASKSA